MEKEKDVKGLMKALKDREVLWRAIRALGRIGEPATEPLTGVLRHRDMSVRKLAADALGKIGDARAFEPLTQALEDESFHVREAAKYSLEKIKAKKS